MDPCSIVAPMSHDAPVQKQCLDAPGFFSWQHKIATKAKEHNNMSLDHAIRQVTVYEYCPEEHWKLEQLPRCAACF